jgi:hypothetical protein
LPVRSYQRIFRPERRLYQIDGHPLPIPGGVPLMWLAWAAGSLAVVLALSAGSSTLLVALALGGGVYGAVTGGWPVAALAGFTVFVSAYAAGVLLGALDWPLRLVVLPVAAATFAGQSTPDGRPAHRYLLARVRLWLSPARSSLGRPVAADGRVEVWAPEVWVAPDHHAAVLRAGRVHGPARLEFREAVVVSRARRRHVVRPAEGHRLRDGETLAEVIVLGAGQVVEVRP